MGTMGAGPFGMSQYFGQPSEQRQAEPMFPPQGTQRPPGHFGMSAAAAPTVPQRRQLDAGPPAWPPGQSQSSQPAWDEGNDPWRGALPQDHQGQQNYQDQGRDAWQWYNYGQGQ